MPSRPREPAVCNASEAIAASRTSCPAMEDRCQPDPRMRALVERRMKRAGNYFICGVGTVHRARLLAQPGDTISVHPSDDGPQTLFEVESDGSLRKLELGEG